MKSKDLHLARPFLLAATRRNTERTMPFMPINKRESLLFTFIIVIGDVLK